MNTYKTPAITVSYPSPVEVARDEIMTIIDKLVEVVPKECRWCGRVFSPREVPERYCSNECAIKAAGINLDGDISNEAAHEEPKAKGL